MNRIPISSIPAKISTEYRLSVQAIALRPPDQMYRIMTRKNSSALTRHGISPLVAISMMMPPPRNCTEIYGIERPTISAIAAISRWRERYLS